MYFPSGDNECPSKLQVSTLSGRTAKTESSNDPGKILNVVFGEQLMRFYKAATLESCDLLALYGMDSRWAGSVRRKVEKIIGKRAGKDIDAVLGRLQETRKPRLKRTEVDAMRVGA